MSFWKDFSKSATDAANFAAKKTGELTTLAKVKLNLHTEESKLSDCFEEIGRLYYEVQRNGKDGEVEIRAYMSAADASKRKIADLKRQIAELQSSSVCPGCGEKISKEYVFCPICGTKQEKAEATAEAAEEAAEEAYEEAAEEILEDENSGDAE